MLLNAALAAATMQMRLNLRNVENMLPIFTLPLQTLVAMAIFVHAGRTDLAPYALSAALLFTIGQMAFFIGSEVVTQDRTGQLLELLVITPTPYVILLAARTFVVSLIGLAGLAEGWLIIRFVFGVSINIHHPILLLATLLATTLSGCGTAVVLSALFSLARSVRTVQNSLNGPLYLLSGVLVPVSLLPTWLQLFAPLLFLYWSANLVRAALMPVAPNHVVFQMTVLLALGLAAFLIGAQIMTRMIDNLRRSGMLGLT